MSEKIWYDDVQELLSIDKMFKVFPLQSMTLEEKINAMIRFFIYIGIILSLIRINATYLIIPIIALSVSYPVYEFERSQVVTAEKFLKNNNADIVDSKVCTRSTVDNPFMNPTIVDIQESPNREAACSSANNDEVKKLVEKNFSKRVMKDVTDIWGRNYSAREFYTVPCTTIPNKQKEYAEWLYGTGATCKEGNGYRCLSSTYRHILR